MRDDNGPLLNVQFHFFGQAGLDKERLRQPNTTGIADPD